MNCVFNITLAKSVLAEGQVIVLDLNMYHT